MATADGSDVLDSSDVVNISEFVRNWVCLITENDLHTDSTMLLNSFAKKEMDIQEDMVNELETVCGVAALRGEVDSAESLTTEDRRNQIKIIPDSATLNCTELLKAALDNPKLHNATLRKLKYRMDNGPWLHALKPKQVDVEHAIPVPEALITVQIYKPFMPTKDRILPQLKLDTIVQVIGGQCLTTLRDIILCHSDSDLEGDFSNNLDMPREPLAKDVFKSGFFFIENVFYNDMRDPDCRDYSRIIRDWAEDPSRGVGPYSSRKMEETCFHDLTVKLGHPYLYMHQGNCEHLIVFTDIRLLHPTDGQDLRDYPMVIGQHNHRVPYCRACQNFKAAWVVSESPHCPEDPCFMCNTCFRMLHYDESGNKLSDFKVHPYMSIQRSLLKPHPPAATTGEG